MKSAKNIGDACSLMGATNKDYFSTRTTIASKTDVFLFTVFSRFLHTQSYICTHTHTHMGAIIYT